MVKHKLYGAILGDLCGQPYEFPIMTGPYTNVKLHNPESHITDDTLMTLATARTMLEDITFEQAYKEMGKMYQGDYYGKGFKEWIESPDGSIGNSYGNGSIMRISPIMYYNNFETAKNKAVESCFCSHLNPISIYSAIKLLSLYKTYNSHKKSTNQRLGVIEPFKKFIVRADGTIDYIERLFWNSLSTHEAIKKAVMSGGDTDTNASIIGELMNYTYDDISRRDVTYVRSKLDPYLLNILDKFNRKY